MKMCIIFVFTVGLKFRSFNVKSWERKIGTLTVNSRPETIPSHEENIGQST